MKAEKELRQRRVRNAKNNIFVFKANAKLAYMLKNQKNAFC